jgi:hypothetical protein
VRLTINGEQVSYSLENERTLGEVVRGIRAWLADAGFLITGMHAAGASGADAQDLLRAAPGDWGGTSVDAVKELDVQATHTGELKLAHWRTVDAWLRMLAEEILPAGEDAGSESGADGLESLLADLPETIESLRTNPFLPPGSDAVDRFTALFKGHAAPGGKPQPGQARDAADEVHGWPAETTRAAAAIIAELRAGLQSRIADAARPADALARCAARVHDSLARLPEVSLLLQTGRDKDAMDIVIGFADTVQALLVLLPFLAPDPERGKLLAEFTPVLKELVAAFGTKDSVLIGDLLEYEIAPRMQRLAPLLEKAS